jgi:hypothetical protein
VLNDNKCIRDGHHEFQSYPDPQDDIPNYDIKMFRDDHELFLKHIGRGQKILNDAEFARKKQEREEAEARAATVADMSDISVSDLELKLEDLVSFVRVRTCQQHLSEGTQSCLVRVRTCRKRHIGNLRRRDPLEGHTNVASASG